MPRLDHRSWSLFITFLLLLTSAQSTSEAEAADCVSAACISVYIENGQIIIEGRKDAPTPVAKPKPRRTQIVTPTPTASVLPLPSPSATSSPRPRRTYSKPVVRKVIHKVIQKVVAAVSLNDRLVKMLPSANIALQPERGAVVGVPVIFWCDLPAVFTSRVSIIGEVIDVTMRPAFFWSFGDGSVMMTMESGAPYPADDISHEYSRPGLYPIVLVSIWEGTWVHNGIARAITGTIRKTSTAFVSIAPAPTRFRK